MVGLEEAADIGTTVTLDVVAGLSDIDAIEAVGEAEVFEWVSSFGGEAKLTAYASIDILGDSLVGARENEVINLTTEKNFGTLVGGQVDILFVGSRLKVEFRVLQDGIDMAFPTNTRFGMALECVLDGKDKRAVEIDVEAIFIPFGILIINTDEGRNRRWRGMGVGILGVTTVDAVVERGGESKEHAENGLFDT
jgi:hypothetical protein